VRQKWIKVVLVSMAICLLGASFVLAQESWNMDEYEKTTGKKIKAFNEAPMLKVKVAAGELPPVEERLPENPLVVEPWEEVGKYGGELKWCETFINYDHTLRHINESPLIELAIGGSRIKMQQFLPFI